MKLSIVVPCYNEQEVLSETTKRLTEVLDSIHQRGWIDYADIIYVDDGSKDSTWSIIEQLQETYPYVHGVKLAHNAGHQNAVWAGLEHVADKCDAAISIDADLQDDVNVIIDMVGEFMAGNEVVYGVRKQRDTDTFFKKGTALAFYKLMLAMGVELVYNHADFRLMGKKVISALMAYPERNIFLRGMVPMIGFQSANVYYDRAERFAGESKYPLNKMLNFAIDGITSFSVKPLRLITSLGILMVLIAGIAAIYALVSYFCGWTIAGWTSMLLSVWLLGGIQLLCIGVIGEYVGKIYKEVKRRPRYNIEKCI